MAAKADDKLGANDIIHALDHLVWAPCSKVVLEDQVGGKHIKAAKITIENDQIQVRIV